MKNIKLFVIFFSIFSLVFNTGLIIPGKDKPTEDISMDVKPEQVDIYAIDDIENITQRTGNWLPTVTVIAEQQKVLHSKPLIYATNAAVLILNLMSGDSPVTLPVGFPNYLDSEKYLVVRTPYSPRIDGRGGGLFTMNNSPPPREIHNPLRL